MFVFSNLATSIDGKIATSSREFFPLGTPADRKQMQVLRREADCVVMGASTIRTFRKFCGVTGAPAASQPMNAIVSSALEGFSPKWPFFSNPSLRRVLFVGPDASPRRLKPFESRSEIVILKKSKLPVAKQVLRELEKRGVNRLLVEGGGGLMWDFASQDLIDEYHLTLTPRVVGGTTAPTLVDGPGLAPKQVVNLKLAQCRVLGDELYLIYRKTGRRGGALR